MSVPGRQLSRQLFTVAIVLFAAAASFMIARQIALDRQGDISAHSCQGICVYLKAEAAESDTLTVKVGETVQFNSADGKPHSLSLGLGGSDHEHKGQYSSGEFQADEAWRVQFKRAGSYTFHDHLNPNINILVVAYHDRQETPATF